MRVLLDTHLLLCARRHEPAPTGRGVRAHRRPANDGYFSSASVWEIAVKRGLALADSRADPDRFWHALPEMGLMELPISARHAAEVVR